MKKGWIILLFLAGAVQIGDAQTEVDLLVYSKTMGYRHPSIPAGVTAIWELARVNDWTITFTEDHTYFSDEDLEGYEAIVFLNTTMDVIDRQGEMAFEKYMNNGGGFVGIHAATDTEYDWEFYKNMIGAQFASHPPTQEARLKVRKETGHPAVAHLGVDWTRVDEWYNFKEVPGSYVSVLLEVDESTIEGQKMGTRHPISWYHTYEGGRVFYTGLGHTEESYADPEFIKHLEEGIKWSAGVTEVPIDTEWVSLLDEDLSQWDEFIGVPHVSVDIEGYLRSEDVHQGTPVGLNDVKDVFTMIKENGEDVLHVSGEIYGGLTSKQEYSNYHLKLQYRWGDKKWEPRLNDKRDSGLLYHCSGKHGAFWNVWMRMLEMQIQEGDTGDLFALAGAQAYVHTEKSEDINNYKFKRGGMKYPVGDHYGNYRCIKSETNERPHGEWNTVELYTIGSTAVHVVNGKAVNVVVDAHIAVEGALTPLVKGKIQLQSEAAEIFYKDVQIRAIDEFPVAIKNAAGL